MPDIAKSLAKLTRVQAGDHRVVSCYLKLEPRDRTRNKYLIKLKNRVKMVEEALAGLDLERSTREAASGDLERIVDYLKSPENLPATQGIALFASRPLKLFEAIPLPRVHRSRLAVDRTPLVRELASVEDEFGRVLVAVLDRTSARFFEVTAFDCRELDSLRADFTRGGRYHGERQGYGGRSEFDYNSRIREEKQRHNAAVADHLFSLNQKQPALGVVLAAPGQEGGAVVPFLHPYLADRVLGTTKLNPKEVTPAQVHAAALEVRQNWERESERQLVNELAERLGAGWGVTGMEPTLRALGRGQVRTLLVNADAARSGFRYSESGRLTSRAGSDRGEG
ncbi:MAG: hypothetical protein AB7I33_14370, partial [Gemmatimonadales bacterium]